MNDNKTILEKDIPLYIDWICHKCKREVALSNTIEFDGRRYCNRCYTTFNNYDYFKKGDAMPEVNEEARK